MEPRRDDDASCMDGERRQRRVIVSALYRQRMSKPSNPNLSLTELEYLVGVPKTEFEFTLWYLSEGGFIKRNDNGNHSILLKGVDLAEQMILDRGH
jgi:hypothetical protein